METINFTIGEANEDMGSYDNIISTIFEPFQANEFYDYFFNILEYFDPNRNRIKTIVADLEKESKFSMEDKHIMIPEETTLTIIEDELTLEVTTNKLIADEKVMLMQNSRGEITVVDLTDLLTEPTTMASQNSGSKIDSLIFVILSVNLIKFTLI
jgi:hypothetical protein